MIYLSYSEEAGTAPMFYGGSLFPWKDSLVLGGLSAKGLVRLTLDGGRVASEERLDLQHRIRDVIEAPDGAVLVITDEKAGACCV